MSYNHKEVETKWRNIWLERKEYKCDTSDFSKPKYYVLDMFPFPSGQGLHVGHPEGYTATDIVSRMKRMQGYNVLHPIGWDAFGLPAEQYAMKMNRHPSEFTYKNIDNFRRQLQLLGFSYDYDREITTCDPSYYKWTQYIFSLMYKDNLAYEDYKPVNFCPELGTVLANEEVIDGRSERGNYPVIRMPMRQWNLRITAYADRLDKDLEDLDWPESTIKSQREWIGRSEGAEITFDVDGTNDSFTVFTTRSDTLFGATYCVLAPEHPLTLKLVTDDKKEEVEQYIEACKSKSDMDRTIENKEKTGVFIGRYAINPINGKKIPIFIGDYVLGSYGSGAVMACPAHDERDYQFAKKYNLEIIPVLEGDISENAMTSDAPHINSDFINGLYIKEAKTKVTERLIEINKGKYKINYKLRDWLFSRQRYWGEPIPIIHLDNNTLITEDNLPLILPELDEYKVSGTGESPLVHAKDWLNVEKNGIHGLRETNTMPQWAGSSWYYIRYIDPNNDKEIGDKKLLNHWLPVDLYIGGQEHAVLHLLYARFWHKFLYDKGIVTCKEPFKRLYHQGMILGENGEKMSKSRGNVINPDEIVENYGADTLRLYEMFMGPLKDSLPWNSSAVIGSRKFIDRVYRLYTENELVSKFSDFNSHELDYSYNYLVKKVTKDFESLDFNTAISQMMIFINDCYKANSLYKEYMEGFIKMFSCICPFVGEELYHLLGHKELITYCQWPTYDETKLVLNTVKIPVQVNGKLRDLFEVSKDITEDEIKELVMKSEKVKPFIENKTIRKIVYVKGKIINIVL